MITSLEASMLSRHPEIDPSRVCSAYIGNIWMMSSCISLSGVRFHCAKSPARRRKDVIRHVLSRRGDLRNMVHITFPDKDKEIRKENFRRWFLRCKEDDISRRHNICRTLTEIRRDLGNEHDDNAMIVVSNIPAVKDIDLGFIPRAWAKLIVEEKFIVYCMDMASTGQGMELALVFKKDFVSEPKPRSVPIYSPMSLRKIRMKLEVT